MTIKTMLIARVAFFIISSAIYPLLIYVILPWLDSFNTGNYSGRSVDSYAIGIGGYAEDIAWCVIWFILSIILAQVCVRAWWIGILTLIVGCLLIGSVDARKKHMKATRLYPYEKFYDNGVIRESGQMIGTWSSDDARHGKITKFDSDGAIESVDTYNRGLKDGLSELYYPDGKMMARGNLKNQHYNDDENILDGLWSFYHKSGRLGDERTYAEGNLLSSKNFKLYIDSAGLVRTITDDKPFTGSLNKDGIVGEYLFPNLYTTQVSKGFFEGSFISHYTIGDTLVVACTTTYLDGKLNGQHKEYHTNGQLATEATYVNGAIEGDYTSYYADSVASLPHGQVKYHCNYKNGERNGAARWYCKNGQLEKENQYVDGKLNGVSKMWNETGKLVQMYTYYKDEKVGPFEEFNSSGYHNKGIYKNGAMIFQERYHPDGTLFRRDKWREDGELIRSEEYDENGELI